MSKKDQIDAEVSQINVTDSDRQIQWIEIDLLLEAIYRQYGYDFRQYGKAHIKRRVDRRISLSGLESISQLQHEVLHNSAFFQEFLHDMSINVTEMFRDPEFYELLREELVPQLKTYPFIKIWHAGCSTGEEVYSMAILLKEEGLYDRTQIYATDYNQTVLDKAKAGIYNLTRIKEFTRNYNLAKGKKSLSDYYHADYDRAIFSNELKENIVYADHNLVVDGVFGEMNLIFCRNVLIYFNHNLQLRVLNLFYDSLVPGGYLCLGTKESIILDKFDDKFEYFDKTNRIYKKIYVPGTPT